MLTVSLLASLMLIHSSPSLPPVSPVPTKRQLAWQEMETNAFVHFGPNTFTDKEWGGGDEDPNLFNPTDLDCDQWVRELKSAGFKGVIITAKHHDGFCLWPSKLSTHTVAQSKWKGGKGDVLRELSDACKRQHFKMGVYLSPWDRNHPTYGTSEYNKVFAGMLKEVLSSYGPVFEVWFDGANGEGPNGKKQVYDWPLFYSVVRKYQPNAVMFSDSGPDVRWVGNEGGEASLTSWSMIPSGRYHPGTPLYAELGEGRKDGDLWVAPECDVSIRPGWFYHPQEETKNRTPENILDLYEKSVGRNSLLLLNVPPDRRGRLTDGEIASLQGFQSLKTRIYGHDLSKGAVAQASGEPDSVFLCESVFGRNGSFWAPEAGKGNPWITITLKGNSKFDRVMLGEPIAFGQRIEKFQIEARVDGVWKPIAEGTTVGRKRIVPVEAVTASAVRVTILSSRSTPALDKFGLFWTGAKE